MWHKISAVIVDDERPAREEMQYLLKAYEDVQIVGVCSNALAAKELIEKFKPDVIFLDISMPKKDGFQLLEELVFIPNIIFVTAHDSFAVKAFEEKALDYLLKPVLPERLNKAIERLRSNLFETKHTDNTLYRNFFLRDGENYHIIKWVEVALIEAYGNYIKLYHKGKVILQLIPLKEASRILDSKTFFQINRAQIINFNHISRISLMRNRRIKIELTSDKIVFCSTRRSGILKDLLESKGFYDTGFALTSD